MNESANSHAFSGLAQLTVPSFHARFHSDIGLRNDAVALRSGVSVGRRRLSGVRREPVAAAVLEELGPAAQMLGQDLAVVLGKDLRRAPVNELLQVGVVAAHGDRCGPQGRAPRSQQLE